MTTSRTAKKTTTAPKRAAKKPPAKKTAGSTRVADMASKLLASPGSLKATPPTPRASEDAAAATAALLGLAPTPISAPLPIPADETVQPGTGSDASTDGGDDTQPESAASVEASVEEVPVSDSADSTEKAEPLVVDDTIADLTDSPTATDDPPPAPEAPEPSAAAPAPQEPVQPLSLVPDAAAPASGTSEPDPTPIGVAKARRSPAKKAAPKAQATPALDEAQQAERLDDLVWMLSSPEHSLDQQHDRISKLTLELPMPLVDVLNRWELDQVRRTGRRLYRERLIDLALAELPDDIEKVIALARDLPAWLKYAETEQVGSRVRAPVALELKVMKQELKLRREKGTYVRHIYAVALLDFLTSYGVPVQEPTR